MAARRATKASAEETRAAPSADLPVGDSATLGLKELAQGILSRKIRPRVGDVRRLAEAVLADKANKKKREKGADKAGGKKRKLSKIPGQKNKK